MDTNFIKEVINSKEECFIEYINEIKYHKDFDGELNVIGFEINYKDVFLEVTRDGGTRDEVYIGVKDNEYGKYGLSKEEAYIINRAFDFYDFFYYIIFELKEDILNFDEKNYLEEKDFLIILKYYEYKKAKGENYD